MKQEKVMNKLIAFVLSLVFIITTVNPVWAAESSPIFTVESKTASAGDQISIDIQVKNNPGVLGTTIELSYASELSLVQATNGEAFSSLQFSKPGKFVSGCRFVWDGQEISGDNIKDGSIIHLVFDVSENAKPGKNLAVSVKVLDAYDINLNPISITTEAGDIQIIDFVPGDVNGDGKINVTDIVLTRRNIVGGYNVDINELAADVNGDSRITSVDIILLRRYVSGGYGVELLPSPTRCIHSMLETPYKAPTCIEEGNIAYWTCEKCNTVFTDSYASHLIEVSQTVLPPTGHSIMIDPAIKPTLFRDGLTEGSHCEICGLVIIEQKEWKLNEYSVTYDIANGDSYIASLQIKNKPENRSSVKEGDTFHLEDLSINGYKFDGWYDGAGSNANKVTDIVNASHNIHLYAHWEALPHSVTFMYDTNLSGRIDNSQLTQLVGYKYYTNSVSRLPYLSLPGYTFIGWSDEDGNICTRIDRGETEDKIYYANFLSNRNQAWQKKKISNPIIYDNEDENILLFAYEIGQVKNVPMYEIDNFGGVISGGVPQTVTKTYSVETSTSLMSQYASTVGKATTQNASWTLSDGWSDSVSVSEEYCKEHGLTQEEADTLAKSETGNYYVSNSKGGSSSSATTDSTDTYNLTTKTNNRTDYNSGEDGFSGKASAELSVGMETEAYVKAGYGAEAEENIGVAKAKESINGEVGASLKTDINAKVAGEIGTDTHKKYGSDTESGSNNQTGTISNHSTNTVNTANWNTESGYSNSNTFSSSRTVSKAISELISEKTGYGTTYIKTGELSNSQGLSTSDSSSEEYGSSVNYSTISGTQETIEYTTANIMSGYHRWVIAGTAHVFGVVGYDIATNSFYTYTYSIMDDETHKYEDYSYSTASYDDNQNSIINFSIPHEIVEYVKAKTFITDGLEVDVNGIVTNYRGTDSYVVIPNYARIDNDDGTYSVIRVTGLSENAFKNNTNITGVLLSDFITDIPDNAFSGCSELYSLTGYGVTSVGVAAFSGCSKIRSFDVSQKITSLGNHAFDAVEFLEVDAANASVVKAAVNSGAKEIVVGLKNIADSLDDTTLTIPNGTETFTIRGFDKSYKNLSIISDANATKINRLNIDSDKEIPLQISSEKINISQSSFSNNGITALFPNQTLSLGLFGPVRISSESEDAMFCKVAEMKQLDMSLFTELTMKGNVVTCRSVTDNGLLKFASGKVLVVDDEMFESRQHPYTLILDVNGGELQLGTKETRNIYNGIEYGELPIPSWEHHTFDGWFTERTGGRKIEEDTIFSVSSITIPNEPKDITIYAHWTSKEMKFKFDPDGGKVSVADKLVPVDTNVNDLPIPEKDYHKFIGWYTEKDGKGTKIDESYHVSDAGEMTLYAYWTANTPTNWVKESEVPFGGKVVSTKWTYTQRSYTENVASTLSGWTRYDMKHTGWGGTQGPVYSDPSNGSRNVWSEQYEASYNYKTVYTYYRWTAGPDDSGSSYSYDTGYIHYYYYDYPLDLYSSDFYGMPAYKHWYSSSNYRVVYFLGTEDVVSSVNYGTRWYYQDPVYTYYYYKDENKESDSQPSGSNISNIEKWVQYIPK